MPTITFKGRVFPQVLKLNASDPLTLGWIDAQHNFKGEVEVTIKAGTLIAKCEVNRIDQGLFLLLYKNAFELSATIVNLLAFATGNGTTVVFDTYSMPGGDEIDIRLSNDALPALCTAFKLTGPSFIKMLELAAAEPLLMFALSDLNDCFNPNRTTLNCARVIETIRSMIYPTDGDRGAAWKKMREALNIDAAYLKFISDSSIAHRHGQFTWVDAETNNDLIQRTWKIMNRFLEYRIRGSQPLTPPEFPFLS